jgi:hypothetical protein
MGIFCPIPVVASTNLCVQGKSNQVSKCQSNRQIPHKSHTYLEDWTHSPAVAGVVATPWVRVAPRNPSRRLVPAIAHRRRQVIQGTLPIWDWRLLPQTSLPTRRGRRARLSGHGSRLSDLAHQDSNAPAPFDPTKG